MKNFQGASGTSVTLRRQLILVISGLLFLLLLGNLSSNVYNLRQYMQWQLKSHAQDAATSLGLSLSTAVDARDTLTAGLIIDAIYDRGYYRSIVLYGLDGAPLIERKSDLRLEGVPGWFVDLVQLGTPVGEADVTSGWQRLGRVTVTSHPGFAYRDLWQLVAAQLAWFLAMLMLGYLAARSLISRLLQPLSQIEAQANAIRQRDFSARSPLPRARELHGVAHAMNSMAERLEQIHREQLSMIGDLREQTYRDELTGLSNRTEFDKRLRAELESEQSAAVGSLMLLQVSHVADFNQEYGRSEGDDLLLAVAQVLRKCTERFVGTLVARRAGADFALYLPGVVEEQADQLAGELLNRLAGLSAVKQMCRNDVLHIGLATTHHRRSAEALLVEADMALRRAQNSGPNGWQRYYDNEGGTVTGMALRPAGEWLDILRGVLARRDVVLHFQPVFNRERTRILHHQVLSRIEVDGQLVMAGTFLPMAERFGLLGEFDQLVVETLLQRLAADQSERQYCVNLAANSLTTDGFIEWLLTVLRQHRALMPRLVLEVPEYSLHYSGDRVAHLATEARALGCQVALDRFGAAAVPFAYLQRIPLDFIKVDPSFVRDIQLSRENQFFLRTLVQIARGLDIRLVAVGVEFDEEWAVIEQLAVDAAMGYYLGRPQGEPLEQPGG